MRPLPDAGAEVRILQLHGVHAVPEPSLLPLLRLD